MVVELGNCCYPHWQMIERVVSGGQTGVDRAALDAAMEAAIPCGGWCPSGRRAEDGPISDRYPLQETEGTAYTERTRRNVEDSDATLIVTRGAPTGGTKQTVEFATHMDKPVFVADLRASSAGPDADRDAVLGWIESNGIRTLNVAGPRESTRPGIYRAASDFLAPLFASLARADSS